MNLLLITLLSVLPGISEPVVKAFWVPGDSTATILVNFRIPPSDVVFKKSGDIYSAALDMELTIRSGRSELYSGICHFRFNLKEYPRTRSDSLLLTRTIKVRVPSKEKYEVKIRIKDVENRDILINRKIKMGPYRLAVSDLIPISLERFREDVKEIAPVEQLPGGTLAVWLRGIGRFQANFKLKNVQSDSLLREFQADIHGDTLLTFPLDLLPSGRYLIVAEFTDSAEKDVRTLDFSVFNIEKLSAKDFDDLIDVLWYIAEPWEIDSLKNAPDSLRAKEWADFWKRRDPTPGTPENELMQEYMERVKYANAHFSYGNIPGYKTDRGMIYIKYGPPDEIERHPFELDSPPYEIWKYYSRNLIFIFVDKSGVGDYELVYPYNGYPAGQ